MLRLLLITMFLALAFADGHDEEPVAGPSPEEGDCLECTCKFCIETELFDCDCELPVIPSPGPGDGDLNDCLDCVRERPDEMGCMETNIKDCVCADNPSCCSDSWALECVEKAKDCGCAEVEPENLLLLSGPGLGFAGWAGFGYGNYGGYGHGYGGYGGYLLQYGGGYGYGHGLGYGYRAGISYADEIIGAPTNTNHLITMNGGLTLVQTPKTAMIFLSLNNQFAAFLQPFPL